MEKATKLVWTALFVLSVVSLGSAQNLVTNPGFETWEDTSSDFPSTYGDWSGDYSSIVTVENSVSPYEGDQMLKFIFTDIHASADAGEACQVCQAIDISGYQPEISQGIAVATVSAYFNRITGDSQTDTKFSIDVRAYAGDVSTYPSLAHQPALRESVVDIFTDGDSNTWEFATVNMLIPINADFIAVQLRASENIYNDTVGIEFDGHYADAVSFTIVPEPATILLIVTAAPFVLRRKRKIC